MSMVYKCNLYSVSLINCIKQYRHDIVSVTVDVSAINTQLKELNDSINVKLKNDKIKDELEILISNVKSIYDELINGISTLHDRQLKLVKTCKELTDTSNTVKVAKDELNEASRKLTKTQREILTLHNLIQQLHHEININYRILLAIVSIYPSTPLIHVYELMTTVSNTKNELKYTTDMLMQVEYTLDQLNTYIVEATVNNLVIDTYNSLTLYKDEDIKDIIDNLYASCILSSSCSSSSSESIKAYYEELLTIAQDELKLTHDELSLTKHQLKLTMNTLAEYSLRAEEKISKLKQMLKAATSNVKDDVKGNVKDDVKDIIDDDIDDSVNNAYITSLKSMIATTLSDDENDVKDSIKDDVEVINIDDFSKDTYIANYNKGNSYYKSCRI